MSNIKISTGEAVAFIITIMIAHIVLSLPNDILTKIGSSSLLNVIFVCILACFFALLIYKLLKNFPGCDILDICELTFGKKAKNILGICFIIYLLFTSGILLRNFCECLRTIYYPNTDIFFVIGFFIISVVLSGILSFNGSLKANLIICPIVLISIVFLFLANIQNFSGEKIFPILGNGFKTTFITGIENIFAFEGVAFLYFLPPVLKQPKDFKKIAIWSTIFTGICLFLCVSLLLFMFPIFLDTDEIMPLFSAARYIQFGVFFQRLESIFLLIWIFIFCCYISIDNRSMTYIFSKITNLSKLKFIVSPFALITIAVSLLPSNYAISKFLESNVYKYVALIAIFIICPMILIVRKYKKKIKKRW